MTRAARRRDEIVRAAFDVIAERGYQRASLAAVAERVGLSQQGLMHYFPSKEHLLAAVLAARDEWDLLRMESRGDVSRLRLSHVAELVEYNQGRRAIAQAYTVLSADSVTEAHPAHDYFVRRYHVLRQQMALLLAHQGIELPAELPADRLAPLLVAVLDGLQLQWLLAPDEVDMSESFRDFLALLGATE
ncbi:TetR/AcrR family transcriptional regulator [Amycolatopsis lurida]